MNKKDYIIPLLAIVCISILFIHGSIPQDSSYHNFADKRLMLGIPNCLNVITNLPFAVVGIMGLQLLKKMQDIYLKHIWFVVSFGFILVTFGSGYYHLIPNNNTLVYDRIPIVLIVVSFFAFIIYDYIDHRIGYLTLILLSAVGIISVIYWMITERLGNGDVRWYAFVQFFPVISIPIIMVLYKPRFNYNKKIIVIFLLFVIARLCEKFDQQLYDLFYHLVSGHSLKHLFMSLAGYWIILLLRNRNLLLSKTY